MKLEIETIENERERGCGYRKDGGLYMMSGKANASCGKLPLELTVCPCCNQGIKPARGFTWINGKKLFEGVECKHNPLDHCCLFCPLGDLNIVNHERMGLIWIGSKHYPRVEDFLKEAREQGVSRRIPAVPKEFVVGETWVLFAHREASTKYCSHPKVREELNPPGLATLTDEEVAGCPDCKGTGRIDTPAIVGCFLPDRIEYTVAKKDKQKKLKALVKRGIKLVKLVRTEVEDPQMEMSYPGA